MLPQFFQPDNPGVLLLMRGESYDMGMITHQILAHHLLADDSKKHTGIIVCADNIFYPSILVNESRKHGKLPHEVLSRIDISRTFTIHQFHAVVALKLEERISKAAASLVVLSGILPLFSDRAVSERDALDLLSRTMTAAQTISRTRRLPFLIPVDSSETDKDRRSRHLLSILNAWTDSAFELSSPTPDRTTKKRRRSILLFERDGV